MVVRCLVVLVIREWGGTCVFAGRGPRRDGVWRVAGVDVFLEVWVEGDIDGLLVVSLFDLGEGGADAAVGGSGWVHDAARPEPPGEHGVDLRG